VPKSIAKSALLVVAVFFLAGARGAPTALAEEGSPRLSRAGEVEVDHKDYKYRCAKGHEREFQGETICDHYCYDDTPGYGDERWDPHYCEGDKVKHDKAKHDKAKADKNKDSGGEGAGGGTGAGGSGGADAGGGTGTGGAGGDGAGGGGGGGGGGGA
jgi:hypothetical protein